MHKRRDIRAVKYSLIALLGFVSFQVNAGTVACNSIVSGQVDGSIACEVSSSIDHSGPISLAAVNAENFFGIFDWQSAGKLEGAVYVTGDVEISLDGDGEGQSGSFSLDESAFTSWDNIMLTFKDGARTFLTGYLLGTTGLSCVDGTCTGSWSTPFMDPIKDVSHISAYVSTLSTVPIPAAVWLFGSGLLGLLGFSRRTKQA